VFVILTAVALGVTPVLAQVHGELFELDGNAVVDNPPADDWANTVPPPPSAGSEAIASTFVADGSGNTTIFTTGGSKDINDISQWSFKDLLGGLPDKDNITNAYAAAYINSIGELIIYFGLDRFANDGDAQMGFWFFKSTVRAVGGVFVGADGVTPATHTIGDILILANLTNGGAKVEIQVFEWVGGANPLKLLASDVGDVPAKCGTNTDPNVCAISNDAPVTAPWPYTPKAGPAGTFPTFSFFEGGVNISALLGPGAVCFSSFLAETRSSQSQNAVLKDFALGEFNTCKLDIVKSCPRVRFDPATGNLVYEYSVTVTNSGIATLFDLTVTDTAASGGYSKTFTQASLAAGASAVFTDTFSLTAGPSTPNPPTNTASVAAATLPGAPKIVTAGPVSAACPQVSFDANLTITKTCVTRLEVQGGRVVVAVDISGTVCNVPAPPVPPAPPAFQSPIDNVTVTDTPAITPISLGTLNPGECKNYSATYFPSTLIGGSGLPGDQTYEDTVLVTGTSRLNNQTKQNTATANCPLCPP
jgi:hypothetical protein